LAPKKKKNLKLRYREGSTAILKKPVEEKLEKWYSRRVWSRRKKNFLEKGGDFTTRKGEEKNTR